MHKNWNGYRMVIRKNHPRANKKLGVIREHLLIAEKALGKPLPSNARVHHPFGDLSNKHLVICQDQGFHLFLHQRERAFLACGHANWRKCYICKKYDLPDKLYFPSGKRAPRHRNCHRLKEYERTKTV